jgi:hypothetical protein
MKIDMNSGMKFKMANIISQQNLASIPAIGYQRDNWLIEVNWPGINLYID